MSAGRPPSAMPRTKTRTGAPLGQHFLVDHQFEQRIVNAIQAQPGTAVLEIGAGPGNMTRLIAAAAHQLISVEIDPVLAGKLQAEFSSNPRVEILNSDILQVDIPALAARVGGKLAVFGNLPYYITSPILMKLFEAHHAIERIVVMMQYEVAERLVARPGEAEYGLLAVTAQYYSSPAILFKIPPGAFNPPPKVMSALVSMPVHSRGSELGIADERMFWKWTRAAFAQKRKTLANNWKQLVPSTAVAQALSHLGLEPRIRAEDLSLRQLAELFLLLSAPCGRPD